MDSSYPRPRTRLLAGVVGALIVAGTVIASVVSLAPPAPRGVDAPANEFSAGRADQIVRTVGQQVHVAGSPAEADVRSEIVRRLRDLGYRPEVHEGIGATAALGGPAMARVKNVVTRIPGTESSGTLVLMAHYDSVQVSYGANDDGSGVATLLETARALTVGPPLKNDVILLFTDAEEACLCGAESFVHSDPLGADGGVVLNFESRGSSGPSIMFETSAGNADLVAQYAAAVPHPVATSMAVEVYRILPNDTDFTPLRLSGKFTGLNSAYIDGSAVYHSPEDRPEYMDTSSLQAHGDNALALTRRLGNADLGELARPAGADATYFPVLTGLVVYPGWLVWPWAVLALAAVAGLAVAVRRRIGVRWGRLAAGFGLMVAPLLAAPVIAQLYWMLLVAIRPGYGAMIDPWRPGWFRLAVCALVGLVVFGWYAMLRRRFGPWALATGGLGWLAVIGVGLAIVTPGGSYLAALPALAGALAGIISLTVRRWQVSITAATLSGIVAALVLAPTVVLFFPALGLATGAAPALVAAMLAMVVLPVVDYLHPVERIDRPDVADGLDREVLGPPRPDRRRPSTWARGGVTITAAVLAVATTVTGLAVGGFDARHPRPTQLMYALNTVDHRAHWVSEQDDPGAWTSQYLTGATDLSATFPMLRGTLATGPAQAADLPAPTVTVTDDAPRSGHRWVTVVIRPQRSVRLIDVAAPGARVRSATVASGGQARAVPLTDGPFDLLFHAPGPDGITLTLDVQGTGPLTLQVADGSDGLTGLPGFVPRPADVGIQGSHTSELVLVATTVTI